jgi:hypothetical protein
MRKLRVLAAAAVVPVVLTVTASPAQAAAPPNDDIAAAKVIPALPYADTLDTTDATVEPDDPYCAGTEHTVWYRFVPASDEDVVAHTFGSDYDTTLSVYTGSPGNLTLISCNDDFQSLQSRVIFDASAGVTYWLMAGSFRGSPGGNLQLQVQVLPPPLVLTVSIRAAGTVDRAGVATVRGTVTCSRPLPIELVGSLRQVTRRSVSLGYFSTSVHCTGTTTWVAAVPGETGRFFAGPARAQVTATGTDPARGEEVRRFVRRNLDLTRS